MKWFSHITIAASVAAVVSVPLVPVVILGATAPDWLERVYKLVTHGRRLRHRGATHYVAAWLLGSLFGYFVADYHGILTAFCFGGLSHVFLDACTITGVPFSPLSDRRVHIFGGRIRTGDNAEYLVVLVVFMLCAGFAIVTRHYTNDFAPFFYDWGGYYQKGLVSGYEWKENRFHYF
jgi:inner membrane protein